MFACSYGESSYVFFLCCEAEIPDYQVLKWWRLLYLLFTQAVLNFPTEAVAFCRPTVDVKRLQSLRDPQRGGSPFLMLIADSPSPISTQEIGGLCQQGAAASRLDNKQCFHLRCQSSGVAACENG